MLTLLSSVLIVYVFGAFATKIAIIRILASSVSLRLSVFT
jgi:hypothetical protein